MTFQEMIFALQQYWSSKGCIIGNPYDIETGAGTFNPNTFLMSLGDRKSTRLTSSHEIPCRMPSSA